MPYSHTNIRTWRMLMLAGAVFAAFTAAVWAAPARANLIVAVNNVGDASDAAPGDGVCETSPTVRGDSCTLRAAIQETNARSGSDAIRFAIPGTGVHKITPDMPLPKITDQVEINGYSQPGAHPNTNDLAHPDNAVLRIELSGEDISSSSLSDSLGLSTGDGASGTSISGLAINRFRTGIYPDTHNGTVTIQGNFIGTNPAGNIGRGNGDGVYSFVSHMMLGGTHAADRNVVSANEYGIVSWAPVTVQGNFVGTQADGASPLGNGYDGMNLSGKGGLVGGSSGANVIAFNKGSGISIAGSDSACRLSRNRIFGNGNLGIDLYDAAHVDDVTPNDHLDGDTGANDLQNFPVLTRAVTGPNATTIQAVLDSTPNKSFTIEFFASPSGTGREGKRFIGQRTVFTGGDGRTKFAFQPGQTVPIGQQITATATNSTGSTSEFSAPRAVTAP